MYTKHQVYILIEKIAKKTFQGKKETLRTFEKIMFQDLKSLIAPLTTGMHLGKAMTTGAQAQTRVTKIILNIVEKVKR